MILNIELSDIKRVLTKYRKQVNNMTIEDRLDMWKRYFNYIRKHNKPPV